MRYHFIGISGAGMSAVAKLLIEQGHTITGSDEGFYPPISDYLTTNNIPCLTPFKKENIPNDADYIVIGKHAKLIPEENEEVKVALASGKKVISFPEALYSLTENRERFVVAGSYGKSTCSALLAWCFEHNKIDAGYFIGALPLTPKTNAHVGTAFPFILEGDEYPSSNWDKTSKFLHYKPEHVLLTALAHDHVNVYPTHADYLSPFKELFEQIPQNGILLACLDDETIKEKISSLTNHEVITYGVDKEASWHAVNIKYGDITTFDIIHDEKFIATFSTSLLGKHNLQNIIGVVAILIETKQLNAEQLVRAISTFKGIVRRLDKKSENTRVPIYEGFGSSHDKARSAIEAIKLHFTNHKLVIIFEPHTFSWRNRNTIYWYDTVFKEAEKVFVYKPPLHGTTSHEQLSQDEILERIHQAGVNVLGFSTPAEGEKEIMKSVDENTVLLILSSGGMDGLIPLLVTTLEKDYPLTK